MSGDAGKLAHVAAEKVTARSGTREHLLGNKKVLHSFTADHVNFEVMFGLNRGILVAIVAK